MSKYQTNNHQQLELLEREVPIKHPAKRVNIVSLKLVRESSVLLQGASNQVAGRRVQAAESVSCGSRPREVCRCLP